MFKCKNCSEKEKIIELLREQNKDLLDRLMSFNQQAFTVYNAEKKQGDKLFPVAMDKDGQIFSYKDTDLQEAKDEMFRAFGEDPLTVEDKH